METKNVELPVQGEIAWKLLDLMYQNNTMKLKDEIYLLLGKEFNLTEEAMSRRYEGGRRENIWEARVRAAKNNVYAKYNLIISKEEENGIWEITEQGKKKYEELARLGLKNLD